MNMGYFKYFLYLNYWMDLAGIYTDYWNTSQDFRIPKKIQFELIGIKLQCKETGA